MIQPKDEPLSADFDDIAESPLKCPKLEKIKEVIVDSTSVIPWIESPQSETCDPLGCNEDEYHPDQEEVSQDVSEYKVTIKPKEEPPYLEFEAIIEEPELGVKVEQSEKEIDDSLLHRLDTKFTSPCVDSSSSETHDDTNSSRSITLSSKSFDAINNDEALKLVAKYFSNPLKKVEMQSLQKIRVESTQKFHSDCSDGTPPTNGIGDTIPGMCTPENNFLYWCRTSEIHETHNLQAFFRLDDETYEDFSNSHDAVFKWSNEAIENLASGKKAISWMDLGHYIFNIPAITNSNSKVHVDATILKSDPVDITPQTKYKINVSSNSNFNSAHPTSTTQARPDTHDKNKYTDSFFCLLWGRKKVWVLLRPENEWKLQNKQFEMLEKLRVNSWNSGMDLPSHPRELLVKPAQLETWDIPYEMVVQCPGDLLYLSDRVVLYVLDTGSNIGLSLKVGRDFTDCAINQSDRQKVAPNDLNMSRVLEAIQWENQLSEPEEQSCHEKLRQHQSYTKRIAIHQHNPIFLCKICHSDFGSEVALELHNNSFHPDVHPTSGKVSPKIRNNFSNSLEGKLCRLNYSGTDIGEGFLKNTIPTKKNCRTMSKHSKLKTSESLDAPGLPHAKTHEPSVLNSVTAKNPRPSSSTNSRYSRSTGVAHALRDLFNPKKALNRNGSQPLAPLQYATETTANERQNVVSFNHF